MTRIERDLPFSHNSVTGSDELPPVISGGIQITNGNNDGGNTFPCGGIYQLATTLDGYRYFLLGDSFSGPCMRPLPPCTRWVQTICLKAPTLPEGFDPTDPANINALMQMLPKGKIVAIVL